MAESDLAARLAAHEHAFEGLLDLIPAKFYNPDDAANQWNKRKQTKAEQVQAKRAKLDPEQNTRQGKRPVEVAEEEATEAKVNGKSQPKAKQQKAKKVKEAKPAAVNAKAQTNGKASRLSGAEAKKAAVPLDLAVPSMKAQQADDSLVIESTSTEAEAGVDSPGKPDPSRNIIELRAKLAAKIEALRTRRKAPGTEVEGAPRSRDAILEVRRKKEAARAVKKKLDKQARKDAALEGAAADTVKSESESASESGSDDDADERIGAGSAVSYGKLTLADGEALTSTFDAQASRKRKHQDPKSALEAALNKKKRLSSLDDGKKQAIHESDAWHKALLQADGEKLRDDVGLLKKAVKRQEATKRKSEKEWKARLSSIALAKKNKQKTREKNLKERREAKGQKGGHKKTKPVGHKGKGKGAPGKKKGF